MSLLKAIKAQLGLSNTPANNFTITAEADNGTLKLARGNAGATTQDILTVDASGKVVFPQNAQVLQNVKASRATGITYVNNTGQPITVMVALTSSAARNTIVATVAGITLVGSSAETLGYAAAITFVVPDGQGYLVNGTTGVQTISAWAELR